ncbi:hypothetical protein BC941DRAFT_210600 [Chlamydoabsidia padenii]|nr:hypothetical protein BC941DRAFT_210600 [Chlamydoabsidia padenii]
MSDIPQSPQHRPRRPEASTSWTLGNSGNITSPMVENSPRSILKEAKTPDIFKVSDVNRSQAERYDDLLSRRVSFASATRVRVYGKNETPNSPSHRTMNQRLSTSSPEGSNALFDDPTSHSPSNRSNNAFLSRLSGSPMDRRKRRRDMFGSPPSQRSTNQPSVVYPEFRFRGMRDLVDEDDDDEGPRHNALFTQVLSQGEQQGRKRLFDDEDDTNIGINNNNNNNNNNTGNIPLGSPNSKTGRFSIVSYNDDNTDAMNIVLQDTTNNIEQTGTSFADTMDLKWNPTNDTTQGMEPISSTQGSLQPLPQTQESDDTNIVSSYTPFKQSSYGITNQPSSQKASQGSSIKFTQDSPVMDRPQVSPHNNKFGTLYNNATKATYAFNTSSPTHSPLHSPLRSPSRSTTLNHDSLSIKSPRVGMSVLESMDASPILPIRSPLRTLSSKQQSHHDSPSDGFSPRRSFYLHDKAQTHSPLVTNDDNDDGDNNNTPSRFTKSPLRHEQFAGKNLSEHSIGSDYGDRMVSLHGSENFNIFEEELPELYDSFDGDSSSSPKPMSLSHFLKSAAGFNSNPTTPRRPKQIPQVDYRKYQMQAFE